MIFDTIDNIASYAAVLPGLREAAAFAQNFARDPKPDDRYEIDGEHIFANVSI